MVDELSLVVLDQLLHCSTSITSALGVGVSCDSNDPGSTKLSKGLILELLGDGPWDKVARGAKASFQMILNRLLVDFSFEANLDSTQNVWGTISVINWA